jgi:hypothetical protein
LVFKERNYNRDPIIKVSGYVYKIVLIRRSILITEKGNKEGRSIIPII